MSKIQLVVLYGQPEDVDTFETHYLDIHRELVAQLPGLESVETGRFVRAIDRGELPHHRLAVLTFADKDVMKSGLSSPEGQLLGADFAAVAPAGTRQFIVELDGS